MTTTLGKNIKELRTSLNLTLADIAKKTGVSRQTIQKYESGVITNVPSDKIELIAEVLGTDPVHLMGWDEKLHKNREQSAENKKWRPTLTEKDEKDIQKQLEKITDQLDNSTGLMFDGEVMDENTKDLLKDSLEFAIRNAKLLAKDKYTPKKYKK